MAKKIYLILLLILVLDLAFSFYQHYHMPLDGDMTDIILPTPTSGYYHVLYDPLGLDVLFNNEVYSNPNRFFAHWTSSVYFLNVPLWLQHLVDPIDSIYLSVAIAKIIVQILILYLLAVFISNRKNLLNLDFLIAAIVITPLFQTSGFSRSIGIIDQSVIYTFFYALPLGLLLLYFLPFFRILFYKNKSKLNLITIILLALFAIVITLNGPLVPGVVLIVCPIILLISWFKNYKQIGGPFDFHKVIKAIKYIPNYLLFSFLWICFLSLYSLYLGKSNSLNFADAIPLMERYTRLPVGLYDMFLQKLGFPLIFLMITVNLIIIGKYHYNKDGKKVLNLLKWIGIFSIIYVILLPLGGHRVYRSNVIRYDTLMPVTIGLIFMYGLTTFFLIKNISKKYKLVYVFGVMVFFLIFSNADRFDKTGYECERQALETIAQSPELIVPLDNDCPVMEWVKLDDYRKSERNAVLFNYWNITSEKKLYYHVDDQKE